MTSLSHRWACHYLPHQQVIGSCMEADKAIFSCKCGLCTDDIDLFLLIIYRIVCLQMSCLQMCAEPPGGRPVAATSAEIV